MSDRYDPKTTPWEIEEKDFPAKGESEEKLRFLLRYAILAPSSHNTQPWKFAVRDNEIRISADKTRWLKVADADQRELHISVGCALENLVIAAQHFGYADQVEYFPQGEDSLVAVVKLIPEGKTERPRDPVLFEEIPRRHTNHKIYDARPIPEAQMARLHACCDEEGFWFFPTNEAPNEAELRRRVDELITRGDAIQFADPTYREELGYWIGQGVFGTPWLMAKITQLAVTYLNVGKRQAKNDSELLLSAPVLAALGSAVDDRKSQVKVGQIFERIALTATHLGMAVHPMSQILEIPELKTEVSTLLPKENLFPQHTFRLGYAEPEKEHTPRRSLEQVLLREAASIRTYKGGQHGRASD